MVHYSTEELQKANPGGSWTGDYLGAQLDHFEVGSESKSPSVYQTKTVSWDDTDQSFQLQMQKYEQRNKSQDWILPTDHINVPSEDSLDISNNGGDSCDM